MECSDNIMTIVFYLIFLGNVITELAFLFQIPYYYFSTFLQCIKIMRILLGILNILMNIYFLVIKYAQNLIKKEENEKISLKSTHYTLLDKIIIQIAFAISLISFTFNFVAIILTSSYLNKKDTSFLANSYYIDSIFFLIENILTTICLLFFLIYWGIEIRRFMKSSEGVVKSNKNNKNRGSNVPPLPSHSSEREIK